jgi:hypothetical protein
VHFSEWRNGLARGFGRITAKAEIPAENGSQANVSLETAEVVKRVLDFDRDFSRAKTFRKAFIHLLFILMRLDLMR